MGCQVPAALRRAQDLRPRGLDPGACAKAGAGYYLFAVDADGVARGCRAHGDFSCCAGWEFLLGSIMSSLDLPWGDCCLSLDCAMVVSVVLRVYLSHVRGIRNCS